MLSAADQLMSCYHSCVGAATAPAVAAPEGGTFKPVDHDQAQHDRGQTPTGIEATDEQLQPPPSSQTEPTASATDAAPPAAPQTGQRAKRSRTA